MRKIKKQPFYFAVTLFENDSITDINYPELLTAFYHYIIYMQIKKLTKINLNEEKKINFLSRVLNLRLFKFFKSKANLT